MVGRNQVAIPASSNCQSFCKLLVPTNVAGSIIGKNGTEITNTEKSTGTTIRLSSSEDTFPGTNHRIMVIGGETYSQISDCISLLLKKLCPLSDDDSTVASASVIAVVPRSSVSGLIGKKGTTIRTLQDETGSRISVSEIIPSLNERVVTFEGSHEKVHTALLRVVSHIQRDPNLRTSCSVFIDVNDKPQECQCLAAVHRHYSSEDPNYKHLYHSQSIQHDPGKRIYHGISSPVMEHPVEIHFMVPDSAVGPMIGRSGCNVMEIMKQSQAQINIAKKTEYSDVNAERSVTISGTLETVHRAHALLFQHWHNSRGMHLLPRDLSYQYSNSMRSEPVFGGAQLTPERFAGAM